MPTFRDFSDAGILTAITIGYGLRTRADLSSIEARELAVSAREF